MKRLTVTVVATIGMLMTPLGAYAQDVVSAVSEDLSAFDAMIGASKKGTSKRGMGNFLASEAKKLKKSSKQGGYTAVVATGSENSGSGKAKGKGKDKTVKGNSKSPKEISLGSEVSGGNGKGRGGRKKRK